MAHQQDVKNYLAYWLQLGKGIVLSSQDVPCRPKSVIQGDRFSDDFEQCWARIQATEGKDCYLEGTDITLDRLLSPAWEIDSCARCGMAVPAPAVIYHGLPCPCSDFEGWPNDELPRPRLPQHSSPHFKRMVDRLSQ